jgi:hypothetical protein
MFAETAAGWRQTAELTATGATDFDACGQSVAIAGNTIAVGAPGHARGSGSVYVYTKTVSGWQQKAELVPPDRGVSEAFGNSVAIAGNAIVVGTFGLEGTASSAGRAYVFTKTASGWDETELVASDIGINDGFGNSVAIAGNTIVVGAPGAGVNAAPHRCRVYVFTKTAAGWQQTAELTGTDTAKGDWFGYSVAIAGNTIMVGAPEHGPRLGGAVYVFTKSASGASGWHQTAEMLGVGPPSCCLCEVVATSGRTAVVGRQRRPRVH